MNELKDDDPKTNGTEYSEHLKKNCIIWMYKRMHTPLLVSFKSCLLSIFLHFQILNCIQNFISKVNTIYYIEKPVLTTLHKNKQMLLKYILNWCASFNANF